MSNRCPYCGAPAGPAHSPCRYGPGGKFYKAPAPRKPLPKTVEIAETPAGTFIDETAPVPDEASNRAKASAGGVSIGKPKKASDPAVAAVADEIAKKKAAKAERQATREGKKPAMAWLDPEAAKALKMAAAKHGVTQEAIVAEGIACMLEGRYKI